MCGCSLGSSWVECEFRIGSRTFRVLGDMEGSDSGVILEVGLRILIDGEKLFSGRMGEAWLPTGRGYSPSSELSISGKWSFSNSETLE